MSVYDENVVEAGSDSFWEVGHYKKSVRRVEDGFELCTKLTQLIQERADIEKAYANNLKKWSFKWKSFLEKGPEYGTMKSAWGGFTEEAEAMSDIHMAIRNRLIDNVQAEVKNWQKENFHKSALPPQRLKNVKEFEERFQKAQKPWAKQYKTVQDCKKAYHNACKQQQHLQHQLGAADSSAAGDNLKKLTDKAKRSDKEVAKTKTAYGNALNEIDNQRQSYVSGMQEVFADCQQFERQRMAFFKDILGRLQAALDISTEDSIARTYDNLNVTIQRADASQDLRWWSQNHGVDMPMQWPEFEEFVAEGGGSGGCRSKKSGSSLATDEDCVQTRVRSSARDSSDRANSQDVDSPTGDAYGANPFDEDAQAEQQQQQQQHCVDESGEMVRALYDYEGAEEDELSFLAGETFEKLDDQDEQGWCRGRKDGRVGLYPANYVEMA